MEVILDELKQYDLKRINDIKNVSFNKKNYTLHNKYYVHVNIYDNIIYSLIVCNCVRKIDMYDILQNKYDNLYEIEHDFKFQNFYDIIYNFCLNNFLNPTICAVRLHLCPYTVHGINNVTICKRISLEPLDISHYALRQFAKLIIISNLNELYLFHDEIDEQEYTANIQIIFKQN